MNKATVLFAATTVILAALSLYLAGALQEERARSEAPAIPAAAVEHQSASATPTKKADAPPANPRVAPATEQESTAATKPSYRDRLTHQTYREAQLASMRLDLERNHPDLAMVLNLRPDESGRFLDLLAKQQLSELQYESSLDKPGSVVVESRKRQTAARQQVYRSEQVALLGDAKMAEWERYLHSTEARAQVSELRMSLADSDYPLRRDQYEPLVAALAAEQQRHDAEREQLRMSQRDPAHPTPAEVIEYMGDRLDLIEASLQRRRELAQSHLDSEQLRRYESMLKLERRRAQVDYDAFVTLNAEAAQTPPRTGQ
jgi:hypothetical protein